ncbi:hypothetical protein LZ31DRAFT_488034, partial [Colletotrichum somersetense]
PPLTARLSQQPVPGRREHQQSALLSALSLFFVFIFGSQGASISYLLLSVESTFGHDFFQV